MAFLMLLAIHGVPLWSFFLAAIDSVDGDSEAHETNDLARAKKSILQTFGIMSCIGGSLCSARFEDKCIKSCIV